MSNLTTETTLEHSVRSCRAVVFQTQVILILYFAMSVSEEQNTEGMDSQLCFVHLLKQYSVILNKSQVSNIKEKKRNSNMKSLLKEYDKKYGIKIKDQQLMKKVNNMKNKVKAKTDINKTGNRPFLSYFRGSNISLIFWLKIAIQQ